MNIKNTILVLVVSFLLLSCGVKETEEPERPQDLRTYYLPLVIRQSKNVSFNVLTQQFIDKKEELSKLNIEVLRLFLGSSTNPNFTLWKMYEAGGWAPVDNIMVPVLSGVEDLGAYPLIMHQIGGPCTKKPRTELGPYSDFVAEFANRYGLSRIEIVNEPDATYKIGGMPSLFGCGQDPEDLIWMVQRAQSQTDAEIGASFALSSQAITEKLGMDAVPEIEETGKTMVEYMEEVAPFLDFAGAHVYLDRDCNSGQNLTNWLGGIDNTIQLIEQNTPGEVLLTEVNLRIGNCQDDIPQFQQAQSDFLFSVMRDYNVPMLFSFTSFPNWRGTGLQGTIFHQTLLGENQ